MPGTRISTVSALLLTALAAGAADATYFPLETGNQWVYRSGGRLPAQTWTLEIARQETVDGRTYSVLRGYPGGSDILLRMNADGALVELDPATKQEQVWVQFSAPEGSRYPTSIDDCNKEAQIVSKNARYTGPLGEFDKALRITYPPTGCADAGLTEEFYLPSVGLLRRTMTTIAGAVSYDLIYARLGGITVISEKQVSFGLSLDRAVYVADRMPPVDPARSIPLMTARITLRNGTDQPLRVTYASGQTYELVLKNDKGEEVWRWSEGRFFTEALRTETYAPGEEKNWTIPVRLAARDGSNPLPAGKYVAEASLATIEPGAWTASAPFEIQHVF